MSFRAGVVPRLDEQERERIVASHRVSLERHGHAPQALFWSSTEAQAGRFRVLGESGIRSGDSLLDVGCGFGDLKAWLEQHGCPVDYSGVDLSPDLLDKASGLHPDGSFYCGELGDFDFAEHSFDWVMLSGALNDAVDSNGDYARRMIGAMYRLCRKGIAFNLLDATQGVTFLTLGLNHFDPAEIEQLCLGLTSHVQVVRGYLKGDFTLRLWRDEACIPSVKAE